MITGRVVTFQWARRSSLPARDFLSPFRGGTPLHAMCAQHMQLGASAVVQLLCRLRVPLEGRRVPLGGKASWKSARQM